MYKVHIGIEIHCALRTKAKMFSSAFVTQNQDPNTSLDIIDLALPGYLPTINKKAVEYGILVCDALHCTIDPVLRFDRKNYAYPDLPKGFQITQQFYPLGKNGYMMIEGQKIGIERVHLEEDTAKMIHHSQSTLLDFNRCGTPLLEIVSTAQIHSVDQACTYVKSLQQKLIYLGVTQGRMDKGQFRCDVNVSLSQNPSQLGDKVELKNLNSISHIRQALDYEIQRQSLLLDQHKKIEMQTRRFEEKTKRTILLRKKETQKDYLSGLIVKSGFNIDANRGFYLVSLDGKSAIVGRIGEEVFVLKKFDRNINQPLQVRMDNPNVYMVKADNFKSLVEVGKDNMGVLIEL